MIWDYSPRTRELLQRLQAFFDQHILPNEERHAREMDALRRAGDPWQPVPSRLVQRAQSVGFRQGSRTLVVLSLPSGDLSVEPIGLGRVNPTFEPEAWVAGVDRRTMALAAPGGGSVIAVHRRGAARNSR